MYFTRAFRRFSERRMRQDGVEERAGIDFRPARRRRTIPPGRTPNDLDREVLHLGFFLRQPARGNYWLAVGAQRNRIIPDPGAEVRAMGRDEETMQ